MADAHTNAQEVQAQECKQRQSGGEVAAQLGTEPEFRRPDIWMLCPTSQLLSSLNRLSNESKQPPSLFATCNSGHGVFSEQARLKPIAAYDSET